MFARIGHLLLAIALLGATGAHWAVLQSVAWTTMIVEGSRSEPLVVAVAETFSGSKPCDLCKRIAAGKQSERKAEFSVQFAKFEFVYCQPATRIYPPRFEGDPAAVSPLIPVLPNTPPVPPPRPFIG